MQTDTIAFPADNLIHSYLLQHIFIPHFQGPPTMLTSPNFRPQFTSTLVPQLTAKEKSTSTVNILRVTGLTTAENCLLDKWCKRL